MSKRAENKLAARKFKLIFISDLDAFAAIIRRETEKEARGKQNSVIKELDPLIFTLHLGSMKIFFSNIETEEKTVDGEVLGELDQVNTLSIHFILMIRETFQQCWHVNRHKDVFSQGQVLLVILTLNTF